MSAETAYETLLACARSLTGTKRAAAEDDPSQEEVRRFVSENQRVLDEARLVLRVECRPPPFDFEARQAAVFPLRDLARAFGGEMRVSEWDGDWDRLVRVGVNILELANATRRGGLGEVYNHDIAAIHAATMRCLDRNSKPSVIVCDTVKGKGVSFMEGNSHWHAGPTSTEQTEAALNEIAGGLR